ncbi:protein disulfide-isomerase precursor [Gonapodya sp. JEL0774]|nr:protein disulfide-isomerase precursor [Gonapodya sp. JEL0774]
MRSRFALITLALAATAVLLGSVQAADSSDVLVLTKSNFEKTISNEKLILVELIGEIVSCADGSTALAPEYEIAATTLKSTGIPIAKVDCTVEEEVCSGQGVRGYPTLKVFRSGSPSDYGGQRKADSIVGYMKKQLLPALSEITAKNVESFIDSDKVVIVGFFNTTDTVEYKALLEVAGTLRDDFVFGATVDEAVVEKYEVTTPSVILFKKFDEGKNVYDSALGFDKESLAAFVQTSALPLVDEVGPSNYQNYVKTGLPLLYLFATSKEELGKYKPIVEKVAAQYKGQINFCHIDANQFDGHGKDLGLTKYPGIVIQVIANNQKFVYDESAEITADALATFVTAYTKGELTAHFKSEEIPAEPFDGNVRVLVGKNFNDIVLDESKDVFVEFYAPWCGHCKKLAPTWESLAEAYESHRDKVVIAKMDATVNDIPVESPFKEIQGFPTIVLFKAGSKEVVSYEGDRSYASLVEFLEGNVV